MPRVHLTDIAVRKLKPQSGQTKFWDRAMPGFGLRVNEHGTKSWVVMFGAQRRLKVVGRYPDMSLAVARTEAKKAFLHRPQSVSTITFEEALPLFLSTHCAQHNKVRTALETERVLRKDLLPTLGKKRLGDIATQHITRIIDALLSKPSAANHAFVHARTFFKWAVRRRYIERSPCEGLTLPTRPRAKDRFLTDTELISLWQASERQGYPFGIIVQLLILTGQRRGEIGALKWNYVDYDKCMVSLPDTKNNRPHAFPIGPLAARLIEHTPKFESDYIFPARGTQSRSFNGWSKSKLALDKAIAKADHRMAPWTLHDLRRTFATNLAALGVAPHITERLLNHVSGTISGVAAIYNRHAYIDEMRDAVSKWEVRLTSLLST